MWQTPGDGEAWWAAASAAALESPDSIVGALRFMRVPDAQARTIGAANDETMNACILALYRSAVPNIHADWGIELPAASRTPGLVIMPTEDPASTGELSSRTAEVTRAQVARLQGLGHAWMAQDPQTSAELLLRFWTSVP
jgi:hypothetical protein